MRNLWRWAREVRWLTLLAVLVAALAIVLVLVVPGVTPSLVLALGLFAITLAVVDNRD